jgi:molybdenum-dependent DNA-binding transcriptional regulator ModE
VNPTQKRSLPVQKLAVEGATGAGQLQVLRPSVNLARVELVSVCLFLECAARGSISAAAPSCNLSVMGASERLRRFEVALGTPLFHRHRKGLELTDAGRTALSGARAMLEAVHQMLGDIAAADLSTPKHPENPGDVVCCGGRAKPQTLIQAPTSSQG